MRIIDRASNKLMMVFKVGISPMRLQAMMPNTTVLMPNPANLIFQKAPKCSYDILVLQKNKGAISKLVK
jgi:hypothetical protein